MIPVYIGWDSREPIAADVCEYSLEKHASVPVQIQMLKQDELRKQMLYTRPRDIDSSTEFTFTRFLVPQLAGYQGWAVFCDCDFVWIDDIQKLMDQADDQYAVMVVKHDYRPQNAMKMDGQRQTYYPRKNWSSMILYNCGHPKNRWLTPYHINNATGQELHRFSWLADSEIGSLSPEWNWLVGWYHEPWDGTPRALHYTEGGPWFKNYIDCDYAGVWKSHAEELSATQVDHSTITVDDLELAPEYRNLFRSIMTYLQDPAGHFGASCSREYIMARLQNLERPNLIGISEDDDVSKKQKAKGAKWDGVVHALVDGAVGLMAPWNHAENLEAPVALRSIAKRKIMRTCLEQGRDFYYIDTGYFGNYKVKDYHRITKNAMQYLGPTLDRPADRLERTRVKPMPMTPGSRILLCPPSAKALSYWGLDEQRWVEETMATIREHTDREIVIRLKQPRELRATVNTMERALRDDIHCMVTFNSIAAVESLIYGKPVFTLGPNAAQNLANTDLSQIENPMVPDMDQVMALLKCLAYQQFTIEEMRTGFAWAVLNGQA